MNQKVKKFKVKTD